MEMCELTCSCLADVHAYSYHSEVPRELQGQGIAGLLAKAAFEFAEEENYRVLPTCSYVSKTFLTKAGNEKYQRLTIDINKKGRSRSRSPARGKGDGKSSASSGSTSSGNDRKRKSRSPSGEGASAGRSRSPDSKRAEKRARKSSPARDNSDNSSASSSNSAGGSSYDSNRTGAKKGLASFLNQFKSSDADSASNSSAGSKASSSSSSSAASKPNASASNANAIPPHFVPLPFHAGLKRWATIERLLSQSIKDTGALADVMAELLEKQKSKDIKPGISGLRHFLEETASTVRRACFLLARR